MKLRDLHQVSDRRDDLDCSLDTPLVKQEFVEECDINVIIARCLRGGAPNFSRAVPIFADVSEIGDFRSCIERIRSADEAFMSLPASVRTRFGNDSVALIEFLQNPVNRVEAISLGLIVEPPKVVSLVTAPAGAVVS
jgi:hypothetical protein